MATECTVQGVKTRLFKLASVKLVTGRQYRDCFVNHYAHQLPGFIAIRCSENSQRTIYLNAALIVSIDVYDENVKEMSSSIIPPTEYKERES